MMIPADVVQNQGDVMRRLADLERQVRELAAARSLDASASGAGGNLTITGTLLIDSSGSGAVPALVVNQDTPQQMLFAGRLDTAFGPIHTLILKARDGTFKARWQSNEFGFEDWSLFDGAGQTAVGCNATSGGVLGDGLDRPHIPQVFQSIANPTDSNGTGTFATLVRAVWHRAHKNG